VKGRSFLLALRFDFGGLGFCLLGEFFPPTGSTGCEKEGLRDGKEGNQAP
jgi:hypothetical protein